MCDLGQVKSSQVDSKPRVTTKKLYHIHSNGFCVSKSNTKAIVRANIACVMCVMRVILESYM